MNCMEVNIDISANKKTLDVDVGDEIYISLEENPTTGYRWHVAKLDNSILRIITNQYVLLGDAVGSGGIRKVILSALAKGNATVELVNFRDSTDSCDSKTYVVTFNVK